MKASILLLGIFSLIAGSNVSAANFRQLISTLELTGGDGAINSFAVKGSTAYAVVSGGGNHRVLQVDDLGGSNSVSTLVDNATWRNAVAGSQTDITGRSFVSGNSLIMTDTTSDGAYRIDLTTTNSVATMSLSIGNPSMAGFDFLNNRLLTYDTIGDRVYSVPVSGGSPTVLLNDSQLANITGDDNPTGITVGGDGVIYFGQGTSAAGENLYFYDPSDSSNGVVATEAEIVGSNDVTFSTTQFSFFDDRIYFRDGGTNDAFRSIDPAIGPSSLVEDLSEAELLALAGTDNATGFDFFRGELAFATLGANGGIYGVPESSTMLLVFLGALSCVHRTRV